MNKIILIVLLLLFFQVNPTLADYFFDWSGVCSNSCGKGTESGTRYYQSCTTDKDSGVTTCSPYTSPTNVSRSCLGASCSGKSMFYQGIASAITLSINKSNYSPSENISVSSNLSVLACANNDYPVLNATVSTSGSSATIFNSYYHGTGEYFNKSTGTFWDYLTTTYVYSASANLTAPASGGNYTVWTNFMSGSIPYTVTAPTPTCTGPTPSHANLCLKDSTGLTSDVARSLVSSCTTSKKCEYICKSGYMKSGSTCVACTCSSSSDYCSGVKYSNSCGVADACTGTKTCSGTRCTTPSYSCSASNFWVKNSSLQARLCSGYPAACPWVTIGTAGCYDDEPCGTATCKNPCTYKLCSSDEKEVLERTKGTTETCTASAGCGTTPNPQCNPDTVFETCETGYVCKPVSGTTCGETNVDCVPKSSSWSEV
jgi:hypothetical protein